MTKTQRCKIEEMKDALRHGSIVVAKHGAGKTTALMEILGEDSDSAIVLLNDNQRREFLRFWASKFSCDFSYIPHAIEQRVFSGENPERSRRLYNPNFKIYVDEYERNRYTGPFHAAITTFSRPLVIIK